MNYIKIKLSKRDVESIEKALEELIILFNKILNTHADDNQVTVVRINKQLLKLDIYRATRTLEMYRKRVKNGIKEKVPYKRTETYKK